MLKEFAGPLAVYADVQDKLKACMARMAAFIALVDEAELAEIRGDDKSFIREGERWGCPKRPRVLLLPGTG